MWQLILGFLSRWKENLTECSPSNIHYPGDPGIRSQADRGSPGQANKCVPNMKYKSASVLGAQPRPSGTLGRGRLTLKYETLGLVLVEYVIAIELSAF